MRGARNELASIATLSMRQYFSVIAIVGLFAVVSVAYFVGHFAINTDINKLISPDLPCASR
jgi:predicted RND superfamily exporter protein